MRLGWQLLPDSEPVPAVPPFVASLPLQQPAHAKAGLRRPQPLRNLLCSQSDKCTSTLPEEAAQPSLQPMARALHVLFAEGHFILTACRRCLSASSARFSSSRSFLNLSMLACAYTPPKLAIRKKGIVLAEH